MKEVRLDTSYFANYHCKLAVFVLFAVFFAASSGAQPLDGLSTTWITGADPEDPGRLAVSWKGRPGAELSVAIDFDRDGAFDASEIVVDEHLLDSGIELFEVKVPPGVVVDRSTRIELRLRKEGERSIRQEVRPALAEKGNEECEWASGFEMHGPSGSVGALAVFDDGTGSALYVGGGFRGIDDIPFDFLAKWDGNEWSDVGGGANSEVRALTVFDDGTGPALYVGGKFTQVGNVLASRVARWDGSSWRGLDLGFNNTVTALAAFDDGGGPELYAAGSFTRSGSVEVNRVARWDGETWRPLGLGLDNAATSLEVYDDGAGAALYAGGYFETAGGVPALGVAKWDGVSWSSLGSGIEQYDVFDLEVFDDGGGPELYAAGFISMAGGVPVRNIARWNGSRWEAVGTGIGGRWAKSMAGFDSGTGPVLYVGGWIGSENIIRWDGSEWTSVGTGMNDRVLSFAVYDDGTGPALYAGGSFSRAGGESASGIARWDGASWQNVSNLEEANGVNHWIYDFEVFDYGEGPDLYATGRFTTAGDAEAEITARWDGDSWHRLAGGGHGGYDLAVHDDGTGSALYATNTGTIHKWDGYSWSLFVTDIDGTVRVIEELDLGDGPALYVGGSFTMIEGVAANNLAKWDGRQWAALGDGTVGDVEALAVYDEGDGPQLFAAGRFTEAGGIPANRIARWDGTNWFPLGSPPDDGVSGPSILALAVHDDGSGASLYAAGSFASAGGVPASNIARWDGDSWSALDSGTNGNIRGAMSLDSGSGAALYVVGPFTQAGGLTARRIARWDGSAWSGLGSGLNDHSNSTSGSTYQDALAIAAFDDGGGTDLYVGGMFRSAGGKPSNHIAKWTCLPSESFPDLGVALTNNVESVVAGGETVYTLTVSNPSSVDVPAAILTDELPAALDCSWTSEATGGAAGHSVGTGTRIEDVLELPGGSSVTYTLTCGVDPDASGEITHTAILEAPEDPNLDDNVAIDTDTVVQATDLSVKFGNGVDTVVAGGTVTYALSVTNPGPSATHATVTGSVDPRLEGCRYGAAAAGEDVSGHDDVAGPDLVQGLYLPLGGTVRYLVTCTVPTELVGSELIAEASVQADADTNPANDAAADTDPVIERDVVRTVILTHFQRLQRAMDFSFADAQELFGQLQAFADHAIVQGLVVDLGSAADLPGLYAAWDADTADGDSEPTLANQVLFGCHPPQCAEPKHGVHDLLREELGVHPEIQHVMVIGDDRIIPMARVEDRTVFLTEIDYTGLNVLLPGITPTNTTVGQAMARNHFLSDDPLAFRGPVDIEAVERSTSVFLPELGIGRLVETPDEIRLSLDTFLRFDGRLDLGDYDRKVLVTGYDFLIDSAANIWDRWDRAVGPIVEGGLIGTTWGLGTATERAAALFDHLGGQDEGAYALMSLNGHATHYEEGVPGENISDIQGLEAEAIAGLDLDGRIAYAVGCHGGLPVAGRRATPADHPFDLPQAFLGAGALAYVANSGFGWGLRDGVGYSERMMELFTDELAVPDVVTLGDAVREAKRRYYLEDWQFGPFDVKTSMQWTVFGFPMAQVQTRIAAPEEPATAEDAIVVEQQRSSQSTPQHLLAESISFDLSADGLFKKVTAGGEVLASNVVGCPAPAPGEPEGCYYTLNDLSTSEGGLPIEPFFVRDTRIPGTSQHGALWLGSDYGGSEETGWTPVFSLLTSSAGSIPPLASLPQTIFVRPRSGPRQYSPDNDCRGSDTELNNLAVVPAELLYDENLKPTIHRLHTRVNLELFYYNNTDEPTANCDRIGPSFGAGPYHSVDGSTVEWSVPVDDSSGVWRVVVVYDDTDAEQWKAEELSLSAGLWEGQVPLPAEGELTYFLQAVDNRGNVSWEVFEPAGSPGSFMDWELPLPIEVTGPVSGLIFSDGFESGTTSAWN